jgi:putative oxidoreductase
MTSNGAGNWTERAAKAVLLIRIPVGWAFVSEGIQKFLFPQVLGPFCEDWHSVARLMAPFVGTIEIICGGPVLIGLTTRLAVIPLFGVINVALYTTRISMISKSGVWSTCYTMRART